MDQRLLWIPFCVFFSILPPDSAAQRFNLRGRPSGSAALLGSLDPLGSLSQFDRFGGGVSPTRADPYSPPRPRPRPNPQPQGPVQMSVELLLVVDKKARDGWLPFTQDSDPSQKTANAVRLINQFLLSAIHGVNTLYASLSEYGLFLDVRITDIKHTNDLWPVTQGSPNQVPTNTAIDYFYTWTWKNRQALPAFDHAMLVTGYDLIDPRNASRPTTGVAYKGVMCKFGSISVVENSFTFQLVDTTAHELGHSLGCDHDGENNGCQETDGYVMSSRTEVNSTNRWHFSPCSADAMKEDIAILERDGANCLKATSSRQTSAPHLGSLFNADKQCQLLFGDDAYFCRDFYDGADDYHHLCSSMWCSENHNSSNCQSHIASDGFVCGDSMICSKGKCIEVDGAPRVSDSCPQGDQPGVIHDNQTCSQIVQSRPWACYDQFFRRKCCISCPAIHNGIQGCEYGDKERWCTNGETKYPYDCYLNNATCCDSCQKFKNETNKGCEYGDRTVDCVNDLDLPLGCYWNENLCCGTCNKYKNVSVSDCNYGDRSTWCATNLTVPNGCYANEELCCDTCAKAKRVNTDNDDCPYGDRYPKWCPTVTPFRCYNETVRQWCCDSCQSQYDDSMPGCEFGNEYENCKDLIYPYACYHPVNQKSCCELCSLYHQPDLDDCHYGDKQAWCWKLSLTYSEDQWCPLDAKNNFCCGTCRHNVSAVPVFGYRLQEEGLEQVTMLGEKFRDQVRAEVKKKQDEADAEAAAANATTTTAATTTTEVKGVIATPGGVQEQPITGTSPPGGGLGVADDTPPSGGLGFADDRPPSGGLGFADDRPPSRGLEVADNTPPSGGLGVADNTPPSSSLGVADDTPPTGGLGVANDTPPSGGLGVADNTPPSGGPSGPA